MRITVGGLLITTGLIGGGAYFGLNSGNVKVPRPVWLTDSIASVKGGVESFTSLFMSGRDASSRATPIEPAAASTEAVVATPNDMKTVPLVAVPTPPASTTAVPEVQVAPAVPPATTAVQPAAPAKPVYYGKRRRVRRRAVAPAATAAPTVKAPAVTYRNRRRVPVATAPKTAAPAAAKVADSLLGTYVTVKLNTGREIQGILREKTATNYKIELPGLGPFDYPAANVLDIQPVK